MSKRKFIPIILILALFTFSFRPIHAEQKSNPKSEKSSVQKAIETFITESWDLKSESNQILKAKDKKCKDMNLVDSINKQVHQFKKIEKTDNIKYTKVDVKFEFYDIDINESADTAKVKFDYVITINYKIADKDSTPSEIYNLHDMVLEKANGEWIIVSNKDLTMPDNAPEMRKQDSTIL